MACYHGSMGITITRGRNPSFINGQFLREMDDYEYEAWGEEHEGWCRINSTVFPRSIDGVTLPVDEDGVPLVEVLVIGDYSRDSVSTSYPEYSMFRTALSQAIEGYNPRWYWNKIKRGTWAEQNEESADPYDIPFMDIINFSDCEGVVAEAAILRTDKSFKDARTVKDDNGLTLFERFQVYLSSGDGQRVQTRGEDARLTFYKELELLVAEAAKTKAPILGFG